MEWWYKSNKYSVSPEDTRKLEDALMSFLRQGNKPSVATLYDDKEFFYIRTTNTVYLTDFLAEHRFNELSGRPKNTLEVLFGID